MVAARGWALLLPWGSGWPQGSLETPELLGPMATGWASCPLRTPAEVHALGGRACLPFTLGQWLGRNGGLGLGLLSHRTGFLGLRPPETCR